MEPPKKLVFQVQHIPSTVGRKGVRAVLQPITAKPQGKFPLPSMKERRRREIFHSLPRMTVKLNQSGFGVSSDARNRFDSLAQNAV